MTDEELRRKQAQVIGELLLGWWVDTCEYVEIRIGDTPGWKLEPMNLAQFLDYSLEKEEERALFRDGIHFNLKEKKTENEGALPF